MKHPVVMPHLGATGGDVKIVEWRIAEFDVVAAGAALLTVETDKSVVEVEAFRGGRLIGPLAPPGSSVAPGEVIGYLSDDADAAIPAARIPLAPNAVRAAAASTSPPPSPAPVSQEVRAARITVRLSRARDGKGAAGFVERLLDAFATMVLIRRYEEHLYQLFLQGLVPGTLHQCQGQEAVAVGVCSALRRDDLIYSTHRPVGHLIAKGASLEAITAEIWGKATGCVGGKGGQMHLADFAVGAMVSNAIVGANIPIATGSAMSFRLQGLDRVAVSFFGDGASNIGAFHEGLNLAAVQDAPAVFVCENNLYAASTQFRLDGAYYRHCCPCGRLRHARRSGRRYGCRGGLCGGENGGGACSGRPRSYAHRGQDLSVSRSLARRPRWLSRARRACGLDGPRSDRGAQTATHRRLRPRSGATR